MPPTAELRFNPFEPAFHDDPYPAYDALRAAAPVFYSAEHDIWFVSRYDDCVAVLRDAETYSNVTRTVSQLLPMLATLDPPRHDELRAVLAGDFTPGRIGHMSDLIRRIARDLLTPIAARGECDLITEFATEVPTRITCALIGVPETRRQLLRDLADQLFPTFDARTGFRGDIAEAIYALTVEILELKRRSPADDIASRLLAARIHGKPLSQEELTAYLLQLIVAGFETTRSLIGNTAWLLSRYPEQRRLLRASPELIRNAIEESLRFESPTPSIIRMVRRAVNIGGQAVPEGATIMALLGAANRDPSAFERPGEFDVQRKFQRPHLAFAYGIHFCLGNHLARLEARICLEEMLRMLADWQVTDSDPKRHRTPVARGFLSLPLSVAA